MSCSDPDDTDDFADVISKLPITYRGYCYDYDTELYYIQGRWYNPEMGRFINADNVSNLGSTGTALSYNLYAYCENNPVMYAINNKDPEFANTINSNYLYNKRISKGVTGYIDDQEDGIATKLRYGITGIHPLGCGWIATYNALKLLGVSMEPQDIIKEYENNGLLMYGFLGTNPLSIVHFFSNRGYDINMKIKFSDEINPDEKLIKKFDDLAKLYNANILYYTHSNGGHFIAFKNSGEIFQNNRANYIAYNYIIGFNGVDYIESTLGNFLNERRGILISVSKK